ncbi:MAG: hypothetical protein ACKVU1_06045 [bacterium]
MDEFQPFPIAAFQHERQRLWDQMRPLNPEMSDEDLANFVDGQISSCRSEKMQSLDGFLESFAVEVIEITVVAHALVEATINAALALGLAHVGKGDLFPLLERADVRHKWTLGPQSFLPAYVFPTSGALYEGLSRLCRRRNSYLHSKITLRDATDKVLLEGSKDQGISIDQAERVLMHRFLSLPCELHQHLLDQIEDRSLRFHLEHILKGTSRRTP